MALLMVAEAVAVAAVKALRKPPDQVWVNAAAAVDRDAETE